MTETRQEKEIRLAAEYAAYVAGCERDKIKPVDYMNWLASKKAAQV